MADQDEKFEAIRRQVVSLRRRINFLALQYGFFVAAALVIATVGLTALAANLLESLPFLATGAVLAIVLAAGIAITIYRALKLRVSTQRAAEIADARAGLKDRVATVVSNADGAHSRLWQHLIEDTARLGDRFVPDRIEERHFSRALYALVAAGDLGRNRALLMANGRDSSHLGRKADSSHPAAKQGNTDDSSPGLVGSARRFGHTLQDKLSWKEHNQGPLLVLLDTNGPPKSRHKGVPPHFSRDLGSFNGMDALSTRETDQVTGPSVPLNVMTLKPLEGEHQAAPPLSQTGLNEENQSQGLGGGGGRASHGSGTDPEHLFGAADQTSSGTTKIFQFAIQAHPGDQGAGAGEEQDEHRISTSINPEQYPDQPVARPGVPQDDEITIRRVFE
jgi:hypothetical protein